MLGLFAGLELEIYLEVKKYLRIYLRFWGSKKIADNQQTDFTYNHPFIFSSLKWQLKQNHFLEA